MANPTPPPPPQKKRGCFFYGCITAVVLVVLLIVTVGIGVHLFMNWSRQMVAQYTDTTPMNLPAEEMPADQLKQLHVRIDNFKSSISAHTNAAPLVLTGADINALINENAQMKGKCLVTVDGNKIKGQISLPLDTLSETPFYETLHLKGRYLNGGGTFRASINNGDLSVFVESLDVKGKPLPDQFMAGLRAQNFAQSFNQQQQNQGKKPFADYESVEVKDSTIIVTPKSQ